MAEMTTRLPLLPPEALQLLAALHRAGGNGWLVGGALRNLLLGKTPKDWDFATTLQPDAMLRLFPDAKLVGGNCGTVSVPFGDGRCEVTPCRKESGYSDRRHPDSVTFVPDILADLSRRDFTVNAMAYDGHVLLDPFGGQEDLEKRLLRCVGAPIHRFAEDPLRILRLFRLAAQLDFTTEWETFKAACDAMDTIATLPGPRVAAEVRAMLMSDRPQVLGAIITKGGLWHYGLTFAPALEPLAQVPVLPLCRWWALIALCGALPGRTGGAFGLSRKLLANMAECTRLYRMGPATDKVHLKQKLSRTTLSYGPIAQTFAAVSPTFGAEPALFADIEANGEPYRVADLAVDGDMLRLDGIRGRACGKILNELLAAVIKAPALNKVQTLLRLAHGLKQLL